MADLSITAASVVAQAGARRTAGTAGASVTAGQVVYLDTAAGNYKLCDVNSATAAARVPAGLALHAAASGQPLTVHTGGPIVIGATLTAGTAYYASGTAGGIRPAADNTTGDFPALLGLATSTTVLNVDIQVSPVAL
jgi:hypothetical protein